VVLTACLHPEVRFKHWQLPNHHSWHDCVSTGYQCLHFAFILQCETTIDMASLNRDMSVLEIFTLLGC